MIKNLLHKSKLQSPNESVRNSVITDSSHVQRVVILLHVSRILERLGEATVGNFERRRLKLAVLGTDGSQAFLHFIKSFVLAKNSSREILENHHCGPPMRQWLILFPHLPRCVHHALFIQKVVESHQDRSRSRRRGRLGGQGAVCPLQLYSAVIVSMFRVFGSQVSKNCVGLLPSTSSGSPSIRTFFLLPRFSKSSMCSLMSHLFSSSAEILVSASEIRFSWLSSSSHCTCNNCTSGLFIDDFGDISRNFRDSLTKCWFKYANFNVSSCVSFFTSFLAKFHWFVSFCVFFLCVMLSDSLRKYLLILITSCGLTRVCEM